jgi:uncharacterized membrane protein YdjX (TVP38/TMEM64 family)
MSDPLASGGNNLVPGRPRSQDAEQRTPLIKIATLLLALGALIAFGKFAGGYIEPFTQRVAELGIWGPAAFIAVYIVAVVAFVPASLLTLAAGAIFGIGSGVAYVFVAASIGSGLAFLVSRYLARSMVEKRLHAQPKFSAIDRAVAEQGLKIVFLLRLTPVIPFNLINYALGLTRVRFTDYMLASFGMLPGTLLYVYSGKIAGDVATLAGNPGVAKGAGYYALLALGLLATIAVTTIVTRTARKALNEATRNE